MYNCFGKCEDEVNNENLTPFTSKDGNNPPPGTGRPKGVRNRATIYRRWLDVMDDAGLTEADKVALAAIKKALDGDVSAIKEVFDSGFGKVPDKVDNTQQVIDMTAEAYKLLTDDQLAQLKLIAEQKRLTGGTDDPAT
jgi:hypothetical protein